MIRFPRHSSLKIASRNLSSFKDFFGGDKSEADSEFKADIEATQVKKNLSGSEAKVDDSNKLIFIKHHKPKCKCNLKKKLFFFFQICPDYHELNPTILILKA